MGGDSVMIWAGIGYNGKTEIKFCSGKMNSLLHNYYRQSNITLC